MSITMLRILPKSPQINSDTSDTDTADTSATSVTSDTSDTLADKPRVPIESLKPWETSLPSCFLTLVSEAVF